MATSIFFSHSNSDRQWCEWLAADAEKVEITVYLAEHDEQPGGLLADKVKRNISKCNALVVLLTDNSVASSYVHQEVGYALGKKKLVIPLVQPGTSPAQLAMLQGVDGTTRLTVPRSSSSSMKVIPFAVSGRWRAITMPATSTVASSSTFPSSELRLTPAPSWPRSRASGCSPRFTPVER